MMRVRAMEAALALSAALSAVLSAAGCEGGRSGPVDATPEVTAGAARAPEVGEAGQQSACEASCEGEGAIKECVSGEPGPSRPCGEGTVCLVDRCVGLSGAVDRAALRPLGAEGWINAFAAAGPFEREALADDRLADDRLAEEGLSGVRASWRRVCGPGPFVVVREAVDKEPKAPDRTVVAAVVVSDRAREAWLKLGAAGDVRVVLNGDRVYEGVSVGRPFEDEHPIRVKLKEGPNALRVRLDQVGAGALGVVMRIRGIEGERLPGLRVALPFGQGACDPAQLAQLDRAMSVTEGGASLALSMRLEGVALEGAAIPWRVSLVDDKGKKIKEIDGGEWAIEASRLSHEARVEVPLKADGEWTIRWSVGARSFDEVVERRGSFARRLSALLKGREAAARAAAPQGSRESYEALLDDLSGLALKPRQDGRELRRRLEQAEAIGAALSKGQDPYASLLGVMVRGYRSPIDGRLQPYAIYVPPSYKRFKDDPFALIVVAHGLNSKPEDALSITMGRKLRDRRAILVAPWGFKHSGQRLMGEADTLAVIDQVRAAYRVDPQRISITGASLGGTVSWIVPLHFPGRFSSIVTLCGYPNIETYSQVEQVASRAPWEEVLLSKKSVRNYAANALHTRVKAIHGGRDAPERAAVVTNALRGLGYWHTFDIQDDLGHNVWDYAYEDGKLLDWMRWRQSPRAPRRDRLVTADYRYDRSIWLRLIASADYGVFAEIDALWDEALEVLTIKTSNVDAFEVDMSRHARQGGAPSSSVVIDGGAGIAVEASAGRCFFARQGGAWARVDKEPSRAGMKRPGVAGPLDDIQTHPQIVVYGTLDPAQVETNRLVAEHFSQQDSRTEVFLPVRADVEMTEEAIAGHSLILIGNPSSNALSARFVDKLPVRFEAGALSLGARRFVGEDVGVSLIHPHPLNPDELIVLHAGVGFEGTLSSRHLPELAPDYLVYDRRVRAQRHAMLMDRREALAGGFFSQSWGVE